jgi:hypothetical protein
MEGKMARYPLTATLVAAAISTALYAAPAQAQATRTWVSGVGDDANPCSRTAPCKTFPGAISKTATGGEINCLDSGGFGSVTITKSIAIYCNGVVGGLLAAGAGVNGIIVNLPTANDKVFLQGLDINGAGNAQNGLRVISAGSVHLHNSLIRNFGASNGLGISFQPSGAGELLVTNTTIADNGNAATGGGVLIQPTGAGGSANVRFVNVNIENNTSGILLNSTGNTGPGLNLVLANSTVSGNGGNGVRGLAPAASSPISMFIDNTTISANTGFGVQVDGAAASGVGSSTARLRASSVILNATGVATNNQGVLRSYGNNSIDGNLAGNGPVITIPLQ